MAQIVVPRLDAPDKFGRIPVRLLAWIGAGIATGPLVAPLVAWLHDAPLADGWGYPLTWLIWLVGLTFGILGACCRPHGLEVSTWLLLRVLAIAERFRGPLIRPRATVLPLERNPHTVADLLALPDRLLWVTHSRPGGLRAYGAEKRWLAHMPEGDLMESQRQHATALRLSGQVRLTESGPEALAPQRAASQAVFLLRSWPPVVTPGWLGALLFDLDSNADVQVVLQTTRLTPKQARDKVRTQRTLVTDVLAARARSGAPIDFEDQANLDSPSRLAVALVAGQEALFDVGLAVVLRASSTEALAHTIGRFYDHAAALGLRWELATMLADWRPTQRIPYRRTIDSGTLLATSPYLTQPDDVGTPDEDGGPLWGVTAATHTPVCVDLWNREAGWPGPHLVVVGPTGGGKTVTLGNEIAEHRTLPEPPDVLIVDPAKGDYRRLVQSLGGQIVRFGSGQSDVVLNAFDLPPATTPADTGEETAQDPVQTQTRLCIGLIALMVTEPGERLRRAERAHVEEAILHAYAERHIFPGRPHTWNVPPERVPILPDILAALEWGGYADLATRLKPFCTGTLSGLFSRPTNLRLDAGVTSFDLEGMDEELRPLAVWLIGNFTWKLAKSDRRRRILVLEEVKTLLEAPESARLVAHLYSLARHYNLSVWSATQLLSDYTTTPEGERALQNAHTALLLRQAAGKGAADAQNRYGLTDEDRAFLEQARVGEAILHTPRGHTRLRVLPPSLVLGWMGHAV